MSNVLVEVLAANQAYASKFGNKGSLPLPPSRRFAILTCMDARLDPAKYAGLVEGDAHVIRNAGGRASDDAIRSLVISYKLLGTREWFVIHHTDCGMALFTDSIMRDLLARSLTTAALTETGWQDSGNSEGSKEGDFIDWLTFTDLADSVVIDVQRIRNHPLVPVEIPIYGFIYDVKTGKLIKVPQATVVGRARTIQPVDTHHGSDFLQLAQNAKTRIQEITVEELQQVNQAKTESQLILIDVREDGEWQAGHITGAVHLSRGIIEQKIGEVAPDQTTPIVCYCGGGNRSALVADSLQKMGYANVLSLEGGFRAWKEAELPTADDNP